MASETSFLPFIHLLCMHESASEAFTRAVEDYRVTPASLKYMIHNTFLAELPSSLRFDLIVSPANSYGILDGGFDDAISRALSPKSDYKALTNVVQKELYRLHSGYLPPGSCCIVKIPESFRGTLRYNDGNGWGCRYLALCPTMRVPSRCDWDKEVVYECIWSLLNAIEQHNRSILENRTDGSTRIESILMTPLGTGTGGISDEKWAKQAVLAIKHWIDAKQNPERWTAINWSDASVIDNELIRTHKKT
ncbi:hypothetical protein F5X96DRAFT_645171 [Biscogniauxia mediterranea]|nr:hypothetical protein F5X96DRAFT_645171 [Biscogniauxia mediterranea]